MSMSESILKGNFIEGNELDLESYFAEENKLDEVNQMNSPKKTKKQIRRKEKKPEVIAYYLNNQ